MKIAFFGTSNVALPILEALNQHHQVLAVVTRPDAKVGRKQTIEESPVSVLAKEMNLPILKPVDSSQPEFLDRLAKIGAEIFVVVSYGHILPSNIISLPKFKTINVHFSLLPKYRGASPIQSALLNGDSTTGTSIFILDDKIDHGLILAQEKIAVDGDDNFITLGDKLARLSAKLLLNILPEYEAGKIDPKPQDDSQATQTKIITKQDGRVDWNKPANQIYNQFRAFYPWPGIWTTWNGAMLKITDCNPGPDAQIKPGSLGGYGFPGTVTGGGKVVCGHGSVLQINALQLAGKNELGIAEFLNGYKAFIGSRLDL